MRRKRPTLTQRVTNLERKLRTLMGEVEDLQAEQDATKQAVSDAAQRVATDIQALHDQIAALAGQANPDLSGVLQTAKDIHAAVLAIDPAAAPAAPPADAPPA